VYARKIDDKEYTFDFGEGLVDDNLLIVDRETRSVWSQLAGTAVSGPMEYTPLPAVPSLQTTWGYWRTQHPDTRVSIREGAEGRPYTYRVFTPGVRRRPPEGGAAGQRRDPNAKPEHDISTLGLGIVVGDEAWFFPLNQLAEAETPLAREIGGEAVTIHYAADGITAWAENAAGEMLVTVLVYQPRWMVFYPESEVFRAEE